jgi:serine-type D-Ala-D-Ala carboxypeptidase (penicillin-binding protein 5/6)
MREATQRRAGGSVKRIAGGVAVGALVAGMMLAGAAAAPAARAATAPTGVRSPWAELADAATGADLWSRSSVTERPMGSITKVLTTPGLDLNRVITVPSGIVAYDEKYDASTAGLIPGERLTTRQLLYAMMLPSGCDAAYTLAGAYGPGLSVFIAKMNAKARALGLNKTRFTDPSGLPDPGEYSTYSTAHDLVNLGRAAMKSKMFAAIVATRTYQVTATSAHRAHTWYNLNPLLSTFAGATGIKTGYTGAAGQCLLFEAKRGSATLIGVVLDSSAADIVTLPEAAADATAMLDWGFSR